MTDSVGGGGCFPGASCTVVYEWQNEFTHTHAWGRVKQNGESAAYLLNTRSASSEIAGILAMSMLILSRTYSGLCSLFIQ
jgi:hypothetical protein